MSDPQLEQRLADVTAQAERDLDQLKAFSAVLVRIDELIELLLKPPTIQ
jgi:hypothetical protein